MSGPSGDRNTHPSDPADTDDDTGGRYGLKEHYSAVAGLERRRSIRYSRFVSAMRIGLLFLALALMIAILADMQQDDGEFSLSFSTLESEDNHTAMLNPRFTGVDANNRPFLVTADKAVQDTEDQRRVLLHNMQAEILYSGEEIWVNVTAPRADFSQSEMKLDLVGPVTMISANGYQLHAGNTFIDIKAGTARSSQPVDGSGPIGNFQADGFSISEHASIWRLEGNVRLILYPGPLKSLDKEPKND